MGHTREYAGARALAAAGELASWQGDVEAAAPSLNEAISLFRELGRIQDAALALQELGWGYFFAGHDARARDCMEQSLELQQGFDDPLLLNRAKVALLQVLVSIGELETVRSLVGEVLQLAQRFGDRRSEHLAHHFLADCSLIAGELCCRA